VLPLVVLLSASGSIFIGLICGVAVVFSIEFIDKIKKLTILLSYFCGVCGALGTLLVWCFAIDGGLLYGGGFEKGVQAIEYFQLRHGQWALLYSFFILKKTMGLE
jgi:Amt family ammonium transporter